MSQLTRVISGMQKAGEHMCARISAEFTREAQARQEAQKASKTASAVNTVKPVEKAPVAPAPQKLRIKTRGWE